MSRRSVEDVAAGARVERAGRLVGEDDLGPGDERAGDRDALLLAAGELGGPVAQAVAEPDAGDDLARQARSRRPRASRSGSSMFCATVSAGSRLNAWKTKPTRSRRSSVRRASPSSPSATPPSRTMPSVGRSRPAAMCRNVLLPEPDGPMTAVNEPRSKPAVTPSSATTAPSPRPYSLRTPSRRTACPVGGAAASGRGS